MNDQGNRIFGLRINDRIAKRILPWLAIAGGCAFGFALIAPVFEKTPPTTPFPVQRAKQRKEIEKRIEAAGDWEILRQRCKELFDDHPNGLSWHRGDADYKLLPSYFTSVSPREIRIFAAPNEPPIVRMKFFGQHRTGGHDEAYYGIWVIVGPATDGFVPEFDQGSVPITGEVKKLTDSVFEVY